MARTDTDITVDEVLTIQELNDIANNSVIYKGNTGVYTAVALGTAGKILQSNGTTSAPTFETGAGGGGTVTDVSVVTANGVSGSVATSTTTPAITLTLGAITPSTVNGNTLTTGTGTITITGTKTLTVSDTATVSGTNTGDETLTTIKTKLGVASSGVDGYLSGTDWNTFNNKLGSLTGAVLTDQTVGQTIGDTTNRLTKLWATDITVTNAITGSVTGNAGTVSTIAGLAPNTATTQATQPNITTCTNLTTVGTIGTGTWNGTTIAVANGGTGATTAQAAINTLSAVAGATNEHVLTKDTATGNAIFKSVPSGFADPMTTRGDIIYKNSGGTTTRLGVGTNGQVLQTDGTDLAYASLTTASVAASTDKNYVTDAQATVIGNTSGTNTGDQTSIVGISGTTAEFNTALSDGSFATGGGTATGSNTGDQSASDFNHDDLANITGTAGQYNHPTDAQMTVLGNTSNTNTGDQTSIVGITGTKSEFDTACTDGNFVYTDAIGVSVQGYDADTAKYDDATANFTGTLQNGGSNVVVDTDIGSTVQAYDGDLTDIAALTHTKGNVMVSNGTDWINVGVGTNDQVLTADSAQTAGVKWAAAGGAGSTGFILSGSIAGTQVIGDVLEIPMSQSLTPTTFRISLGTVPTGADFICKLYKNGTEDASATIATGASTTNGLYQATDTTFVSGSYVATDVLKVEITQVGSGIAGADFVFSLV